MIDFGLYRRVDGGRLALPSLPVGVTLSHNRRGPSSARAFIPATLAESFAIYNHAGLLHAVAVDGSGAVVWAGRVEDVKIESGGVSVQAMGYARIFNDVPYTALWSSTAAAEWRQVTDNDDADSEPARYQFDTNGRLYIALRKGEEYKDADNTADLTYAAPHGGQRNITAFSASYSVTLPVGWELRLIRCDDDFNNSNVVQTIAGTGSNATGTISQTFTGQARLIVQVRNNTGSDYTVAVDTGTLFVELTDIRVKTTAAIVTASAIAQDILSYVTGINSEQVRTLTTGVIATTNDLHDQLYEDAQPAAILDDLAELEECEWGVGSGRMFYFWPRGNVRKRWFIDAATIELERSLEAIYNSVYATYRADDGRTLRTAVASNSESLAAFGLTRREPVRTPTTDATEAEAWRDARLSQQALHAVRARVTFSRLLDASGIEWPLWSAIPGDTMTIRNLPAQVIGGDEVDNIATFRIDTADYDADRDSLRVEPDTPIPTLITLVAERTQ